MTTAIRRRLDTVPSDVRPPALRAARPHLSIVIPVYRAEGIISELVRRLKDALFAVTDNYEIVLVNDGSPDRSWDEVQAACRKDKRLLGIKLSRNFGQHCAITAGLRHAKGQWVVVMDCDLQDRPEEIGRLLAKAEEGCDIVFARRCRRADGFLKRQSSKLFYKVLGYLTETKQDPSIGNFGIYHRKVIDAILSMDDHVKFFPTMVKWVGFDSMAIDVQHAPRWEGETTYNLRSLIDLATNVILSFSDKPLRLTVRFGILISFTSFCFALVYLAQYFAGRITVLGYTSLIISIWFLSGIIITLMGMLGLYVGRIFEQTKNRPTYIVDRTVRTE